MVEGGRVLARMEGTGAVIDYTFIIICHGNKEANDF